MSRLMHQRNPVSVLPLPVGASSNVLDPPAMTGQPCACGAVGALNASLNHRATTGWKRSGIDASCTIAPAAPPRPFCPFRTFRPFRPFFRYPLMLTIGHEVGQEDR